MLTEYLYAIRKQLDFCSNDGRDSLLSFLEYFLPFWLLNERLSNRQRSIGMGRNFRRVVIRNFYDAFTWLQSRKLSHMSEATKI